MIESDGVSSLHISWKAWLGYHFFYVKDLSHFVHYLIFHMDILSDFSACKNDTVLDHSTFVDYTATSNDGILNGSLYLTAIGYNRVADHSCIVIMSRTGVIGTGVDRPFRIKQSLCCLDINKLHIEIIVALEICDGSKETTMEIPRTSRSL